MVKVKTARISFLFLILCLLSVKNSAQQGSGFEVEIALEQRVISTSGKPAVKVKFTNLATADFETKSLINISFFLLKFGEADFYLAHKDLSKIIKKIKPKTLKQNDSIEFEIKLNKVKWHNRLEATEKGAVKFNRLKPAVYKFYAVIDVEARKNGSAVLEKSYYGSNTVAVKLFAK